MTVNQKMAAVKDKKSAVVIHADDRKWSQMRKTKRYLKYHWDTMSHEMSFFIFIRVSSFVSSLWVGDMTRLWSSCMAWEAAGLTGLDSGGRFCPPGQNWFCPRLPGRQSPSWVGERSPHGETSSVANSENLSPPVCSVQVQHVWSVDKWHYWGQDSGLWPVLPGISRDGGGGQGRHNQHTYIFLAPKGALEMAGSKSAFSAWTRILESEPH